mgnify:CR=1 FL=1|tara:strand:- start:113 stop:472 length:360 start_codon:yes stop_codon:yes gene_type:complete
MFKVVINQCYGGFSLSFEAVAYIFDNMSQEEKYEMRKDYNKEDASDDWNIKDHIEYEIKNLPRHHKLLIEAVEKFGEKAGGTFASLSVEEIKGNKYIIKEYDGYESVVEPEDIKWVEVE